MSPESCECIEKGDLPALYPTTELLLIGPLEFTDSDTDFVAQENDGRRVPFQAEELALS
jgi:hypothetical protein